MHPTRNATLAPALVTLARLLKWPILSEASSGLRFGAHDLTGVIAHHDVFLESEQLAAEMAPDLMVRIGQHPTCKSTANWIAQHGQARTLLIDPDGRWHDPAHVATDLVVSDPEPLCKALATRLKGASPTPHNEWLERWSQLDTITGQTLDKEAADGFWQASVTRALVNMLPDGALLHAANSMPIRNLDSYSPAIPKNIHVATSRGLNGIDGTLSTTLGEAAAWNAPVALLTGDLAFLHDTHALVLAKSITTPVVVVVVDNQGGGIFDHLPIAAHPTAFEPFFITAQPIDIPTVAGVTGLPVTSVSSHQALEEAIAAALARPGVTIIHVPIDRAEDLRRHTDTRVAVHRILQSTPLPPTTESPR
jgi:2-succinyl-5-enolpyruvyl-6-hydroxy-3-cyclohexene-1-carboxylate synthase